MHSNPTSVVNAGSHWPPGSGSSTSTATAAPAATQRSCWRSTPREARNRSTTQTNAAGKLTAYNTRPLVVSTVATLPATPASPNGLSIAMGTLLVWPGDRMPPTTNMATPTTAAATTSRQRRDRSRPLGNSRNGRVMPRAIAGAQMTWLATTASWATSGSG
jgi:hypothetical protein